MDLTEFHAALKQLTADDIHDVARSLASDTAGDEVDAWHATIAIDRVLRHSHRTRQAAARRVRTPRRPCSAPPKATAWSSPTSTSRTWRAPRPRSRRGMTAGDECVLEVSQLLQHWFRVLARA